MSSTIPNARLIGTAKPSPSAPTSAVAIAVVIPINSPLLFNKAPPLEPLVIGASVTNGNWSKIFIFNFYYTNIC